MNSDSFVPFNKNVNSIRILVSMLGIFLSIAGIIHGYYEVLQGNKGTNGVLIQAIGKDYQNWMYGGEEAITLIPNFLITGLVTISISIILLIWTLFFINKNYGSSIFLVLNVLSFLTGGGIFQIVIFTLAWIFSTRINGSLDWWKNKLSQSTRDKIKNYWFILGVIGFIPFIVVQEIGIFGYVPGITDPEIIMNIVMSLLIVSLVLYTIAFICSLAFEIDKK